MGKTPFVRLLIFSCLTALVTGALGYFVCLKTGNSIAMFAAMALVIVVGLTLSLRWWISTATAAGIPMDTPTPSQWTRSALCVAALFGAAGLEFAVFHFTKNRVAEAASGFVAVLPIGFILLPWMYRLQRAPTATETSTYRLNSIVQLSLVPIFGFSIFANLQAGRRYGDDVLQDFNFAMGVAIVSLAPFAFTMMRRRYLEAKALKDNAPPDRWQAYKNKLASNE